MSTSMVTVSRPPQSMSHCASPPVGESVHVQKEGMKSAMASHTWASSPERTLAALCPKLSVQQQEAQARAE